MLRLSPPGYLRFCQADSYDATYGGGEANVAVSLAHFGFEAFHVTRVPDNPIGQSAVNYLRRFGVDTRHISYGGERLGIYFMETGASQRPSLVVYDRRGSAISEAIPGEFQWNTIFKEADWLHITGITPALSDKAAAVTLEACRAAKNAGVTVSCDINYRKKLWNREKARAIMTELMPYVQIAIANEEDAEKVFGIKAEASDVDRGQLNETGYREVARQLLERFNLRCVAISLRESHSASDNGWSGMLYDGRNYYNSRKYEIRIVDRVGGGDSFAAGLIYGILTGWTPQETIEFAVAASCLKQTIYGDFNMMTFREVQNLAGGESSGRVQR